MFVASQFKNSNLGYYLYAGIVVLIGAASIFVFWFMITGFNIGRYSENTTIGNISIVGLTEQEAEDKLRNYINTWLEDDLVIFELSYQGYSYAFDRDEIFFDIERSLDELRDGRANTLYVEYSETVLPGLLAEIDAALDEWSPALRQQVDFDFTRLIENVLRDASDLKRFSSHQLNDFVPADQMDNFIQTLMVSSLEAPATVHGDPLDVAALETKLETHFPNGITITPGMRFSMLDSFDPSFTRAEMSFIGALIMDIFPHTPFTVHRHHQFMDQVPGEYDIATYPFYGRNVHVQRSRNLDFQFENNTHCTFTLEFERVGNAFTITLIGAPFINTIDVETTIHYFDYPTTTTTNPDNVRPGVDGVVVTVRRTITNIFDEVLFDAIIIYEVYSPIEAIVLAD